VLVHDVGVDGGQVAVPIDDTVRGVGCVAHAAG
jgi:hypothetical protein